MEHVMF